MPENKAWYRFLKVIYITAWIFAFIIIGVLTYSQRPYDSINYYKIGFKCSNGQSWEFYPTNSVYNLDSPNFTSADEENVRKTCAFGNDYKNNSAQVQASLPDKNYSLYNIYDHYGSSSGMWWTLIISFLAFFIIIEGIKSAVLYIVGVPVMRGGLLYMLLFLASFGKDKSKAEREKNEKKLNEEYRLLFEVVDKKDVVEKTDALNKTEQALIQLNNELQKFYKKTGHGESFYKEGNQVLDTDLETMEEFFKLDDGEKELRYYKMVLDKYFSRLDKIKAELDKGMGIQEAKKYLKKLEKEDQKELTDVYVKTEFMKAISEELVKAKQKNKDLKSAQININDVAERIYQKHPEWRK